MKELIRTSLIEAEQTLASFLADEKTIESIAQAADSCSTSLRNGHKIISCGNGGSLCDATHFAEEHTVITVGLCLPLLSMIPLI